MGRAQLEATWLLDRPLSRAMTGETFITGRTRKIGAAQHGVLLAALPALSL
jgi:hypothetical protein